MYNLADFSLNAGKLLGMLSSSSRKEIIDYYGFDKIRALETILLELWMISRDKETK